MEKALQHVQMQAEVTGEGAPLVLIPGGLMGWLSWEPHARRLASMRKVIRVQLISVEYGLLNSKLPSDYSLKMESMALEATLNGLRLTAPADLAAWSYGAAITLDYALNHQDRVRTLTLIELLALWALGTQKPSGEEYESLLALCKNIHGDVSEAQLEQFVRAVGLCPPGKAPRELPQWQVWMLHRRSLLNTSAPFRHRDNPAAARLSVPGTAGERHRFSKVPAPDNQCARRAASSCAGRRDARRSCPAYRVYGSFSRTDGKVPGECTTVKRPLDNRDSLHRAYGCFFSGK
ncbi:Haloalkane dehalogenase [uncultured archaeon]|nr:Haloalkane dehalogenase [uncultured archaeon]